MKIFMVTGDIHRSYQDRFKYYSWQHNPDFALIVLGDLGFNWFCNKNDIKLKRKICENYSFHIYAVRGNHEARPQNIPNMKLVYDKEVQGEVYQEDEFPNIHYFKDFGEYVINGYKTLVIGGAYSVDKYYRLSKRKNETDWCGWFPDEQLSQSEMKAVAALCKNNEYDLILTHTCPISWEPQDLFLSYIKQEEVDKTMENFLETEVKEKCSWRTWLFGHYHADRIERPHVEQLYQKTYNLNDIMERWHTYDLDGTIPYYLNISPNFYKEVDEC